MSKFITAVNQIGEELLKNTSIDAQKTLNENFSITIPVYEGIPTISLTFVESLMKQLGRDTITFTKNSNGDITFANDNKEVVECILPYNLEEEVIESVDNNKLAEEYDKELLEKESARDNVAQFGDYEKVMKIIKDTLPQELVDKYAVYLIEEEILTVAYEILMHTCKEIIKKKNSGDNYNINLLDILRFEAKNGEFIISTESKLNEILNNHQ